MEKQLRLDYFNIAKEFYRELILLGEKLILLPKNSKSLRLKCLREYMINVNKSIQQKRKDTNINIFEGNR